MAWGINVVFLYRRVDYSVKNQHAVCICTWFSLVLLSDCAAQCLCSSEAGQLPGTGWQHQHGVSGARARDTHPGLILRTYQAQNRWNVLEMQTSSLWDICIHWDGIVAWIIILGGHRGYTKLCLGFCKWDYARGSFLQSRSGKQLRVFIALIKTPITKSTGGGGAGW